MADSPETAQTERRLLAADQVSKADR